MPRCFYITEIERRQNNQHITISMAFESREVIAKGTTNYQVRRKQTFQKNLTPALPCCNQTPHLPSCRTSTSTHSKPIYTRLAMGISPAPSTFSSHTPCSSSFPITPVILHAKTQLSTVISFSLVSMIWSDKYDNC